MKQGHKVLISVSKAVCLHESSICSSLAHTVLDLEEGVYVRYRLDGSLFDLQRLKAKNEDAPNTYPGTLFAHDCTDWHMETETDGWLSTMALRRQDCFGWPSDLARPKSFIRLH